MENNEELNMCIPLPVDTADEGVRFLEGVVSGNVGAGVKMNIQGNTIPLIRTEYKRLVDQFERDLIKRKKLGLSAKELAKWAVKERTKIAGLMRRKQGVDAKIILDLRDNFKYGLGGRTYENLEKRAASKGVKSTDIPDELLKSATRPNKAISDAALKGAKFLKHGGKAVVVISISITAYTLLTAPEHKLEEIMYEEIGGAAGGFVGGGTGVGLCIVFGIATSGWGLLACGVVGGGVGGLLGAEAGNKVYLLKDEYIQKTGIIQRGGFEEYNPNKFMRSLP
jgi:hypothetical protein